MSCRPNVLSVKCPVGQMSCRPIVCRWNVLSANCLSVKCPVGQVSVGQRSCRSKVCRPNVRSWYWLWACMMTCFLVLTQRKSSLVKVKWSPRLTHAATNVVSKQGEKTTTNNNWQFRDLKFSMHVLFLLHVSFRTNELEKWRIVCNENKLWEKLQILDWLYIYIGFYIYSAIQTLSYLHFILIFISS